MGVEAVGMATTVVADASCFLLQPVHFRQVTNCLLINTMFAATGQIGEIFDVGEVGQATMNTALCVAASNPLSSDPKESLIQTAGCIALSRGTQGETVEETEMATTEEEGMEGKEAR